MARNFGAKENSLSDEVIVCIYSDSESRDVKDEKCAPAPSSRCSSLDPENTATLIRCSGPFKTKAITMERSFFGKRGHSQHQTPSSPQTTSPPRSKPNTNQHHITYQHPHQTSNPSQHAPPQTNSHNPNPRRHRRVRRPPARLSQSERERPQRR